jgi:hypothetical protein
MKLHYTITTNSPYPIETKGVVDVSGIQIAARIACNSHKETLRGRKALRKWGETTTIKMVKLPDDVC